MRRERPIKRIAVSQRVVEHERYPERRDALDQRWAPFLRHVGIVPIPLPNTLSNVEEWLSAIGVDGLLLTSGNDLSDAPGAVDTAPERDQTERQAIEILDEGTSVMQGHVRRREWYMLSPNNAQLPGTFEAVGFFADSHLNLPPVIGSRLSLGTALLNPLEVYTGALTLVWKPHWGYVPSVAQQLDKERQVGAVDLREVYPQ